MGFGSGAFISAAHEEDSQSEAEPRSVVEYQDAPPFRVRPISASRAGALSSAPEETGTFPEETGTFSTAAMIEMQLQVRRRKNATPLQLRKLLMPVQQVESGENFCVALTHSGLVFAWGDGEEGKLGLGDQKTQRGPMVRLR